MKYWPPKTENKIWAPTNEYKKLDFFKLCMQNECGRNDLMQFDTKQRKK